LTVEGCNACVGEDECGSIELVVNVRGCGGIDAKHGIVGSVNREGWPKFKVYR
jgi:hypothetical protein